MITALRSKRPVLCSAGAFQTWHGTRVLISPIENMAKVPNRRRNDLAVIQASLEKAGIEFIDSVGVVQLPPPGKAGRDKEC
jgi:hypothetical protein